MMQQALNAVIYARYSSHNQTEQSIEGQLRDCYAFAEREGLQVIGEYIDRAITGRTDERPDFQRMIADARKQEFQRVIVWKFDRFSRDRYDSAIYKHKLKQCGVRVLSAMENVGEGDVSIILEALLEASAEQYSLDLSKKVLRGQRESRLKGTFLGGLTPIGYKLENRKLVADERTAPIVRYIFEQYAKGTSKQDIINELATRGILNRHGKPLSHSTLQTILKNKKYIGVYTHGGQDVAGGCEALIDEKTFLKVQEQLSKRKHAPAASKAVIEYLLQGKLYCGYCGFNMFGDSGRGRNGSTYRYYACRRRKKERDCKKKNEKKDFIEWYVVEQTVEYVLTPERIEYIASELVAQYKKDCGIDRIKTYEKQLDRIKAEISRLVDTLAVCPAAARQPIFDKMEQLDAEKQEVELDLSKLRISAKIQISKEHIADWLKQFCNGDALDVDFQKRIIDTFINSVYLYDDKVIIYYNIEGGKQVSYIDMIDSTEEPPFSDDAPGSSGGSDLKRPALVELNRNYITVDLFTVSGAFYLEDEECILKGSIVLCQILEDLQISVTLCLLRLHTGCHIIYPGIVRVLLGIIVIRKRYQVRGKIIGVLTGLHGFGLYQIHTGLQIVDHTGGFRCTCRFGNFYICGWCNFLILYDLHGILCHLCPFLCGGSTAHIFQSQTSKIRILCSIIHCFFCNVRYLVHIHRNLQVTKLIELRVVQCKCKRTFSICLYSKSTIYTG